MGDDGFPVDNAHITSNGKGVITDFDGFATLTATQQNQRFTFSHVAFKNRTLAFNNIGNTVTMQTDVNTLPPVVITAKKKPPTPPRKKPTAPPKKDNTGKVVLYGTLAGIALAVMTSSSEPEEKPTRKEEVRTLKM